MIPVAFAEDIDESDLAVGDSFAEDIDESDLAVEDSMEFSEEISIQDIESSDDKSQCLKELEIKGDEETKDENLDGYSEDDFSQKTILNPHYEDGTYKNRFYESNISASFLDNDREALNYTEVVFRVNEQDYSVNTDSNGFAKLRLLHSLKNLDITLFNPITGENYTFEEIIIGGSDSSSEEEIITEDLGYNQKLPPTISYFSYNTLHGNLTIYATFLDNDGDALSNSEVLFRVYDQNYSLQTDYRGRVMLSLKLIDKKFIATLFNLATGENFTFTEKYPEDRDSIHTLRLPKVDNSSRVVSVDTSGVKSIKKNDKGTISKAITYSKGNVILSTRTTKNNSVGSIDGSYEDSMGSMESSDGDSILSSSSDQYTEKIVIDRFTRYKFYLIVILCIVLPIGYLRYRKKGSK